MSPVVEYTKERVGDYLVIGKEGGDWKVMEKFGSYRMFKKTFKTQAKAMAMATEVAAKRVTQ